MSDSAGRSWAGRAFEPSPWTSDDGTAPERYLAALRSFRDGAGALSVVIDALRDARLLVPLVADRTETGRTGGRMHEKRADLALVTVAGPDGRRVLPAFSSAAAMAAWDPAARPVPAPARRVALGAAADGTELVVVDAASPERFGLRRGALEALARDQQWTPPWLDADVRAALVRGVASEPGADVVEVESDDPLSSLDGAEVRVVLRLPSDPASEMLSRIQRRWTEADAIRLRVDSLAVRLTR